MKLKEAVEAGYICGLETVGESVDNIYLHYLQLFSKQEQSSQLSELDISCFKEAEVRNITMHDLMAMPISNFLSKQ